MGDNRAALLQQNSQESAAVGGRWIPEADLFEAGLKQDPGGKSLEVGVPAQLHLKSEQAIAEQLEIAGARVRVTQKALVATINIYLEKIGVGVLTGLPRPQSY